MDIQDIQSMCPSETAIKKLSYEELVVQQTDMYDNPIDLDWIAKEMEKHKATTDKE